MLFKTNRTILQNRTEKTQAQRARQRPRCVDAVTRRVPAPAAVPLPARRGGVRPAVRGRGAVSRRGASRTCADEPKESAALYELQETDKRFGRTGLTTLASPASTGVQAATLPSGHARQYPQCHQYHFQDNLLPPAHTGIYPDNPHSQRPARPFPHTCGDEPHSEQRPRTPSGGPSPVPGDEPSSSRRRIR